MVEYVKINNLRRGDILARTVYDSNMRVLLRENKPLTDRGIQTIKEQGYKGIYINHGSTTYREEIALSAPLVDDLLQLKIVALLKEIFANTGIITDHFNNEFQKQRNLMDEYVDELITIFLDAEKENRLILEMQDNRAMSLWIYYHSLSVCMITIGMGIKLGLERSQLKELGLAAIYHDLGKIFYDIKLLYKTELCDEERAIIRQHPTHGFRLMQRLRFPLAVCYGIWQHHEHIDGSGYPNGLKADKILLSGKLIGLASAFDNYVNPSPYNTEYFSNSEAIEKLYGSGIFDATCIKVLLKVVAPYPVGVKVKLSNNAIGIVIKNNTSLPLRPTIAIGREYINLAYNGQYHNITITETIED